jgi:hypothetical protein
MSWRHVRQTLAAALLLVVGFLVLPPPPAYADNCANLGDCSAGAQLVLALGAVLLIVSVVGLLGLFAEAVIFAEAEAVVGAEVAAAEAVGAEAEVAALRALGPAAFNPAGATTNCWLVSQEVLSYLQTGAVEGALPAYGADMGLISAGTGSSFVPATFEGIHATLAAAGPGSNGIVAVFNAAGTTGHAFAAANVNGAVIFADLQSAAVVSSSASEVAGAAGFGSVPGGIFFLPL